jgi:hypothetical protein
MMMMNNGLSQQVLHRPKAELVFRSPSFPARDLVQIIFGAKLANSEPPSFPAKYLTFKNGAKLQPRTVPPACKLIGILEGVVHVQPKNGRKVQII